MEIECIIKINLEDVQRDYKNQLLNNEKVYKHISENIDNSNKLNISFREINTKESGNRGFLSQLLEKFNQL